MRKISFWILAFIAVPFFVSAAPDSTDINMAISPIKYDIAVPAGKSTTKTITFYNNASTPYTIYLSADDCVADSAAGTPECRAPSGSGVDLESLATWITFDGVDRFTVPAKGEKKITFTITPPVGAIPGGHYGAVFLNNVDTTTNGGNQVKMIRRAGVLLLVNIPGKLVYKTEIGDIEIDIPLESAPMMGSRTPVPKWREWINKATEELDPRVSSEDASLQFDTSDFSVTFTIPVKNSGNTHILPLGRIELYDENNILLQKVGKEAIMTPEGVSIGEKIVDYLPINDETSSVLPGSDRIFKIFWRGFAYQMVEDGKSVIKYLSPQSYYSQLETKNTAVLMPWEKYRTRPVKKNITAKISLEYRGENGEPTLYEKNENVVIHYLAPRKELNYGAILIAVLIFLIIWALRAYRREDSRIGRLEKEVEYMEDEIDELERGRMLARKALEKKSAKHNLSKKEVEKVVDTLDVKPRTARSTTKKTESVPMKSRTPRTKKTDQ